MFLLETIDFLEGRVAERTADGCVLDVGGIGWYVHVPMRTLEELKMGSVYRLYVVAYETHKQVILVGFLTRTERFLFQKLVQIQGVGVRTALAILSVYTPERLITITENQDLKALQAVRGVGSRLARRIVVELSGALPPVHADVPPIAQDAWYEALGWLEKLGISAKEAKHLLTAVWESHPEFTAEEAVRAALRQWGGALIQGGSSQE